MADPVTSIGGFTPRSVAPTRRTTTPVRRSGLAPLPAFKPFVSKQAKGQEALTKVVGDMHSGRSIGAQIGGVFAGLPAGAVHLAHDVGVEAFNTAAAPFKTVYRHGLVGGAKLAGERLTSGQYPFDATQAERPFSTGVVHSMEDTAGRIAQLSPVETKSVLGRKVHTYGDMAREGDIVNAVLGDALNVSLVAGGAGRLLGGAAKVAEGAGAVEAAAKLAKLSDAAGVASRMGGRIANAPMEAVGGVMKGARSLWRVGAEKASTGLLDLLPAESRMGRRVVGRSTVEGRLLKGGAAVESRVVPPRLANWMGTNLAKDAGMVDANAPWYNPSRLAKDAPSLIEQEVGLTRAAGVAQADKMVSDLIGADASIASHIGPINKEVPGQTMTREGQALAHQYEAGTLPPEQMARIDRVTEAFKKQVNENITPQALAGEGQKALDPAQNGDAPLNDQVQIRLMEGGMAEADVQALQSLVDSGAQWKDLAALEPSLGQILHDPQVYPRPWREAMNVFGQGAKAADEAGIAHNLPRTPEEILAAGIERPTYMPGGKTSLGSTAEVSSTPVTEGFGGVRSVSAEKHAATLGHGQYSLATAAEALGRTASTAKYNQIIEKYMQDSRIPSAKDVLARPDKLGQVVDHNALMQEAIASADAANFGGMSKGQLARDVQMRYGQSVIDELHQRGYDVLEGNRLDPRPGDFNPKTKPDPMNVGPDSIVLPTGLKQRLVPWRLGTDHNLLIALNSKGNAWFKRNVLPFNAHWTIGDMTSNLLMAWRSGAVNPIEMFQAGRALKNLDPAALEQMFNRPEFLDAGLKYQAAKAVNPMLEDRGAARTPFGKVVRRGQEIGFGLNKMANRLQRHEYVYAKLERELKARGLGTIEGLGSAPDVVPPTTTSIGKQAYYGWADEASRVHLLSPSAPPVEPGFVRLYRGEDSSLSTSRKLNETQSQGTWFTPDRSSAEGYGSRVGYVDLPAASVADELAVNGGRELNLQFIEPPAVAEARVGGSAKWKDPEVQKAIEDVVNDANHVLGTWDEMSPLEQRVATQIFPFWSWIRHITTLVARTAVDNPTRVLWTLRVGALGMNATPDSLPSFMRGSINTPLGRFNVSWANPFYDVGTGGLASPSAATRSLSPLIKVGIQAATGRDPSRDLNVTSHRPGTDPNQFGSALYGLTQSSPFIRGAMNLAPTVDVPGLGFGLGPHRRYGSGQTILTPGTDNPADNQSRTRMALNMVNFPLPQQTLALNQKSVPFKRKKTGLGRSGLGGQGLKKTGLGG